MDYTLTIKPNERGYAATLYDENEKLIAAWNEPSVGEIARTVFVRNQKLPVVKSGNRLIIEFDLYEPVEEKKNG